MSTLSLSSDQDMWWLSRNITLRAEGTSKQRHKVGKQQIFALAGVWNTRREIESVVRSEMLKCQLRKSGLNCIDKVWGVMESVQAFRQFNLARDYKVNKEEADRIPWGQTAWGVVSQGGKYFKDSVTPMERTQQISKQRQSLAALSTHCS